MFFNHFQAYASPHKVLMYLIRVFEDINQQLTSQEDHEQARIWKSFSQLLKTRDQDLFHQKSFHSLHLHSFPLHERRNSFKSHFHPK